MQLSTMIGYSGGFHEGVERIVALNDVTTPEALSYIDHQLKRLGVTKMLAKSGARQGDVVWIAGFSFEYHEDL